MAAVNCFLRLKHRFDPQNRRRRVSGRSDGHLDHFDFVVVAKRHDALLGRPPQRGHLGISSSRRAHPMRANSRHSQLIMSQFRAAFLVLLCIKAAWCRKILHPECRKAGAAVIVPTASGNGTLVIWAGKGNHRELIFDDMWTNDLAGLWAGPVNQCAVLPSPGHSLFIDRKPSCARARDRWKTCVGWVAVHRRL